MNTYEVYYPNGLRIDSNNKIESFIEFYNMCYYFSVSPQKEQIIENILYSTKRLTCEDIGLILEWKTGGHYENKSGIMSYSYGIIDVLDVANILCNLDRGKISDQEAIAILCSLCKVNQIGIVYAITLLYFLTNGQYPIYDRFVHIALIAIKQFRSYGSIITEQDIRGEINLDKSKAGKKDIEGIFRCYQECFVKPLTELFACNRRTDRALWVYGHLFNETQTNKFRAK